MLFNKRKKGGKKKGKNEKRKKGKKEKKKKGKKEKKEKREKGKKGKRRGGKEEKGKERRKTTWPLDINSRNLEEKGTPVVLGLSSIFLF